MSPTSSTTWGHARAYYNEVLYSRSVRKLVPLGRRSRPGRKVSTTFSHLTTSFVRSVDRMESAVLVPSKLIDVPIKDDPSIHEIFTVGQNSLYDLFQVAIQFRNRLQETKYGLIEEDAIVGTLEANGTLYQYHHKDTDSGIWSTQGCRRTESEDGETYIILNSSCDSGSDTESPAPSCPSSPPASGLVVVMPPSNGSNAVRSSPSSMPSSPLSSTPSSTNSITSSSDSTSSSSTNLHPLSGTSSGSGSSFSCSVWTQDGKQYNSYPFGIWITLVQLSNICEYIIDRYLEEMNCDYCE